MVAADGVVLVEHEPQDLRGARERFEALVVDVGAVEQPGPGVVGHVAGGVHRDVMGPVPLLRDFPLPRAPRLSER